MKKIQQTFSWGDHFFNIVLTLLFILPQNEILYYFIPVAIIFVTDWKKQTLPQIRNISFILIASMFVSLLINFSGSWIILKNYFKMIELSLLFITFGHLRNILIIREYIVFLITYLLVFQFAYQLDLPFISEQMQKIYPLTDEELEKYIFRETMEFSDIGGYMSRLGGIYYNSNICASYLEMLLLLLINERQQFNKWIFIVLVLSIGFGIVSTGSRTSMLILIFLAVFMLFEGEKKEIKYFLLLLFVGIFFFNRYGYNFRSFMFEEGMNDSFNVKLQVLKDYLAYNYSPLKFLFGCFSGQYLVNVLGFGFAGTDFDFGDIIVTYGFVFFGLLLWFIWVLFKSLGRYRIMLCMLLWCFSNTIFMSYRASAIFILIASMYYSRNLLERNCSQ